jgi:phosphohistidine phosphatase SixA
MTSCSASTLHHAPSSSSSSSTRRCLRHNLAAACSSSSSSSSSSVSSKSNFDATFGHQKWNIFVPRQQQRRAARSRRPGRAAVLPRSKEEESTRKLNFDDESLVLSSSSGADEEPDVYDLMSAKLVPYEKTYRVAFLRHAKSSYSQWAYSSSVSGDDDDVDDMNNNESGDKSENNGDEDEEDNFDLPDKYRSIAPRGKIGASAVAKMLVAEYPEFVPSIIITSDATRCLDTVECFTIAEPEAFGKSTVILAPEFYEVAHGSDVKAKRIRKAITKKIKREAQMRGAETVCVVGHNAGWENVVKLITKSSKKVRLKTSNCALVSCKAGEMTWEEALTEGEWRLEKILRVPKELNRKAKLDYPEEDSVKWKEEDNEAEADDEDEEGGEINFDEYVST